MYPHILKLCTHLNSYGSLLFSGSYQPQTLTPATVLNHEVMIRHGMCSEYHTKVKLSLLKPSNQRPPQLPQHSHGVIGTYIGDVGRYVLPSMGQQTVHYYIPVTNNFCKKFDQHASCDISVENTVQTTFKATSE